MKTYFSLVLSALLFVTQSVWLSKGICSDGLELKSSIISDLRLSLAHKWEEQGKYYQKIQDTMGIETADQELIATANKNFNLLYQHAFYQLNTLDETEAQKTIETIHTLSPSEAILSAMSDRTKTNKQKLETALKNATIQNHEAFITQIQNRAHEVGYAKTFTEIANQMRNRSYNGGPSTAQAIGGLLGYLLILAGVIGLFISFSYYPPFNDFIVVFFGSVGVGMIGIFVIGASGFML